MNWQRYHEIKQNLLLKIHQIVGKNDAQIAFPTRTLKVDLTPELAGLDPADVK